MRYENRILINLPCDETVAKFSDPDNLRHWMAGFLSQELLSGVAGKKGAKTRMRFKMGKRDIELVETILENALPDRFVAAYETPGVHNRVDVRFEEVGPSQTLYFTENEFRFSGWMRLFGMLMPGAFKRQTQSSLLAFKDFAERGVSLAAEKSAPA